MNIQFNSNISYKTAGRYVREDLVGVSPQKKGPVGDFPKQIYPALKGAYAIYLKLEQAGCAKQSSIKQMAKLVNACVNRAGFSKI